MELQAVIIAVNYCIVHIILDVALNGSIEFCQHQYYKDMVLHALYIYCFIKKNVIYRKFEYICFIK